MPSLKQPSPKKKKTIKTTSINEGMNKTFLAKSSEVMLFDGKNRTLEQYIRDNRRSSPSSESENEALKEGPRQMEDNEFSVSGKDAEEFQ